MHDYDDDDEREPDELPEDADEAAQTRAWQWLLLVNPGDEETALQQFAEYRDALESEHGEADPVRLLLRVTDWRSGFHVAGDEPQALVEVVDELVARWNLAIDWGLDVHDEERLAAADVATLLGTAHDRLSEHGYSLWAWETEEGGYAGWITRARDGEPLRELAASLHLDLHPGSDFS